MIKQKITTNILIYLEQEFNKLETILTFIYLIFIEDCFLSTVSLVVVQLYTSAAVQYMIVYLFPASKHSNSWTPSHRLFLI